jgi:hypothetical protein
MKGTRNMSKKRRLKNAKEKRKTVMDVVNSVDPVSSARKRIGEKYVAFDCDDLDDKSTWHKLYEKEGN